MGLDPIDYFAAKSKCMTFWPGSKLYFGTIVDKNEDWKTYITTPGSNSVSDYAYIQCLGLNYSKMRCDTHYI